MTTIEARGLARRFRSGKSDVNAVCGVDLDVAAGEIIGFVGPNGAGKTTTLRMLTTLLRPTSGTAHIAGIDLVRDPAGVRRASGYVAQSGGVDPNARVAEELCLQGRLYRLSRADAVSRATRLLHDFDLNTVRDRQVRTLSGGQRRRMDIAMGLMHSPSVLFLDEPTTGLDPQSRGNVWDHVRALREDAGTTVFLTTHYLDEADALCDRLFVIDHGRIVARGTPDELKRGISGDLVTIEVSGDTDAAKVALAGRPGIHELAVTDRSVRLVVDNGERAVVDVMQALQAHGVGMRSIRLARPTLDDVFLTLTGRSLRDGDA
ncbi:ATP-binding cassette domain-containing protein [Catenuloplanes indicus]|uniref:ABC-2 type transport system ATP-binding protein n=1 Tax=Catenuloplanes indicus TaxID=137267 RepID=A0AAE3VWG1_9ACTN|nr:ATP-binding cassette domain-containing protein [Catenuloplanes indicus]MDQ0364991.1 ABC-2 type transport system ATP-binding protein [Catenuloplanes indicus]